MKQKYKTSLWLSIKEVALLPSHMPSSIKLVIYLNPNIGIRNIILQSKSSDRIRKERIHIHNSISALQLWSAAYKLAAHRLSLPDH